MALIFLFPLISNSQTSQRFKQIGLTVEGGVQEVIPEDLDEDNIKELMVFHRLWENQELKRLLTIFWTEKGKDYANSQKLQMNVPKNITLFDTGKIPGIKGKVILVLTPNEAKYYTFTHFQLQGPFSLFPINHLIQIGQNRAFYYDLLYDWNGDGEDELGVFEADGIRFYKKVGNNWKNKLVKVPLDISTDIFNLFRSLNPHSSVSISYRIPQLASLDVNKDKKKDLIASIRDQVFVFYQDDKGEFSSQPSMKLDLHIIPSKDRESFDRDQNVNVSFSDLDNDGIADIITTKNEGGFANHKGYVSVYFGKNCWRNDPKPLTSLTFPKPVFGVFINDADADGFQDLIIPTIDIGFFTTAKAFVMGSFPVEFSYYFFTPQSSYPKKPTFVDTVDILLDMRKGRISAGIPNLFADFNGDKIPDLVYGANEKELVIVVKNKDGQRTNIREKINVPTAIVPVSDDLNSDGKSEVILYYVLRDDAYKGDINLLINVGPW